MGVRGTIISVFVLIVIVAGIGLSTMRYQQINEGERGLIITQGRVEGVQEPGIFFRPFAPFTAIEVVDIRRQSRQISQNVASSDKQLYDIDIQVDYRRDSRPESLKEQYGSIGVSEEQLHAFLDGFINDALKSASTQFTLDQALSDRNGFSQSITRFLSTPPNPNQKSPVDQIYVVLEAVKVLDIKVGEQYAKLLSEKANLEVQIETEQKRRQQIEAQQANNLFQSQQEAEIALTQEKGRTAAQLEVANREAQVRAIQGRYWRENPELFELRKRELMVEMLNKGSLWFVDPNTNLTLLLNNMATGTETGGGTVVPVPVQPQPAQPEPQPQPTQP